LQGVKSLEALNRKRAPLASMKYLLDTLEALHRITAGAAFTKAVTKQLFDAVFCFAGAFTFNLFIDDKQMFRCDRGLLIRFNIATLTDWGSRHSLRMVEGHFLHLVQAVQLLQTPKVSLQQLDAICYTCRCLNSLQVERILKFYRPGEDEEGLAPNLADCVKARFLASLDDHVYEDESVGCRVQLHRNPLFWLPFRLAGHSRMGQHLVGKSSHVFA
jgi:myosin heavy subunit